MISSLLHLVGLRPRVYYTLNNFRGGGQGPLAPPPQYANECITNNVEHMCVLGDMNTDFSRAHSWHTQALNRFIGAPYRKFQSQLQ